MEFEKDILDKVGQTEIVEMESVQNLAISVNSMQVA